MGVKKCSLRTQKSRRVFLGPERYLGQPRPRSAADHKKRREAAVASAQGRPAIAHIGGRYAFGGAVIAALVVIAAALCCIRRGGQQEGLAKVHTEEAPEED